MVNLTQTATLEDRISPEGRAAFDTFYASLVTRTREQFKALHVLADPHMLFSLDFGVESELILPPVPYAKREWPCCGALGRRTFAIQHLISQCDVLLDQLDEDQVMPTTQPRESWWEFWIADFIGMKQMFMPHARKGRIFVILRGVVR